MGSSHNTILECTRQINTMHLISRHHLGRALNRRRILLNRQGQAQRKVLPSIINPVLTMDLDIIHLSPIAQRRHLIKTPQW
jgi:hypothetical protein